MEATKEAHLIEDHTECCTGVILKTARPLFQSQLRYKTSLGLRCLSNYDFQLSEVGIFFVFACLHVTALSKTSSPLPTCMQLEGTTTGVYNTTHLFNLSRALLPNAAWRWQSALLEASLSNMGANDIWWNRHFLLGLKGGDEGVLIKLHPSWKRTETTFCMRLDDVKQRGRPGEQLRWLQAGKLRLYHAMMELMSSLLCWQ